MTCATDLGQAPTVGSGASIIHGAISGSTLLFVPDAPTHGDEVRGCSWPELVSTFGLITFCDGTNIEDMTVDDVVGHANANGPCRIYMIAAQFAGDEQIQRYDPIGDSLTTLATIAGAQNIVYQRDNGLLYVESSDAGGTLYTVDPDTGATVNLGTYSPGIFARTICAVPGGLWGWDGGQSLVFLELDGTAHAYTVGGTVQLDYPIARSNGDAWFQRRETSSDPWLGWQITQALSASRLVCLDDIPHLVVTAYQSPDATDAGVEEGSTHDQWRLATPAAGPAQSNWIIGSQRRVNA